MKPDIRPDTGYHKRSDIRYTPISKYGIQIRFQIAIFCKGCLMITIRNTAYTIHIFRRSIWLKGRVGSVRRCLEGGRKEGLL